MANKENTELMIKVTDIIEKHFSCACFCSEHSVRVKIHNFNIWFFIYEDFLSSEFTIFYEVNDDEIRFEIKKRNYLLSLFIKKYDIERRCFLRLEKLYKTLKNKTNHKVIDTIMNVPVQTIEKRILN